MSTTYFAIKFNRPGFEIEPVDHLHDTREAAEDAAESFIRACDAVGIDAPDYRVVPVRVAEDDDFGDDYTRDPQDPHYGLTW